MNDFSDFENERQQQYEYLKSKTQVYVENPEMIIPSGNGILIPHTVMNL